MQNRPTYNELLQAVAEFLETTVPHATEDPALRSRALVGANLLGVIGRELAYEEQHVAAELTRLARTAPDLVSEATLPADLGGRRALLAVANTELDRRISAGALDGELATAGQGPIWQHLRQTLAEKLDVVNPGFDTSRVIEPHEQMASLAPSPPRLKP